MMLSDKYVLSVLLVIITSKLFKKGLKLKKINFLIKNLLSENSFLVYISSNCWSCHEFSY